MKTSFVLVSALSAMLALPALAATPAETAAQTATTVCAACHGPDGNSFNGDWPKLAGQHASYTAAQLTAFRCAATGKPDKCVARSSGNSALMLGQAANLSDADIQALAEHFAHQTIKPGVASAELATKGEKLYRGGNPTSAVPACAGCHGPNGRGNDAAKFPAIGGQHAQYVETQLKAYRDGSRRGDLNQMMRNIASNLTDDEIKAVASYVQGLR
jgi:cytochrome c553